MVNGILGFTRRFFLILADFSGSLVDFERFWKIKRLLGKMSDTIIHYWFLFSSMTPWCGFNLTQNNIFKVFKNLGFSILKMLFLFLIYSGKFLCYNSRFKIFLMLTRNLRIISLKLMSFSVFAGSFRLPLQLAVSFSIIKARVSI